MSLYSLIAIAFFGALLIGFKQMIRGLKFWPSFFISFIALTGVLAVFSKMLG